MIKVKAVIFDMDGLMVDTEPVGNAACVKANKELGYTITQEMLFNLIGRNETSAREYYYEQFGKSYPYDEMRKKAIQYQKDYYKTHDIDVKKGLYELLDDLKEKGIKMAVASSTHSDTVRHNLDEIKVTEYFDCIIGGEQIVNGKPSPDIFLKAIDMLDVKNHEALVLEDSKNGILASYAANIPVICIPDIVKHDQDTLDKTYCVLDSLDQCIDIIEKDNGNT